MLEHVLAGEAADSSRRGHPAHRHAADAPRRLHVHLRHDLRGQADLAPRVRAPGHRPRYRHPLRQGRHMRDRASRSPEEAAIVQSVPSNSSLPRGPIGQAATPQLVAPTCSWSPRTTHSGAASRPRLATAGHAASAVRVGTVDLFQGQEAPVVLISLATSSDEDVPRSIEFLFSRNRLNVAVSRAQCLAIVVANPQLLDCTGALHRPDATDLDALRVARGSPARQLTISLRCARLATRSWLVHRPCVSREVPSQQSRNWRQSASRTAVPPRATNFPSENWPDSSRKTDI